MPISKETRDMNHRLALLGDDWCECQRCPLGKIARKHVPLVELKGEQFPRKLQVLFVGEGPGEAEDMLGRPFIGPSGRLLRKALAKMPFPPESTDWGFTNLVACRPQNKRAGDNRQPSAYEIHACSPRLEELIRIYEPRVVVALGNLARDFFSLNLHVFKYSRFLLCVAVKHPSFILRDGGENSSHYDAWVSEISGAFLVASTREDINEG